MGKGAWGKGHGGKGMGKRERGKGKRGKIKFISFCLLPFAFNLFPLTFSL